MVAITTIAHCACCGDRRSQKRIWAHAVDRPLWSQLQYPVCSRLCGTDCAVCSKGYTAQIGQKCSKCSDSTGGIVLAAVLAVLALLAAAAVVSYVTSGERAVKGQGIVERVGRYIPLQSLKIVIVAWQILTQVGTIRLLLLGGGGAHRLVVRVAKYFNTMWSNQLNSRGGTLSRPILRTNGNSDNARR